MSREGREMRGEGEERRYERERKTYTPNSGSFIFISRIKSRSLF
jgi:hypothetical protein